MDHREFLDLTSSYTKSQAVAASIRLGIFCELRRPMTSLELSQSLALNQDACERLLLLLMKLGLVSHEGRQYQNSDYAARFLTDDSNESLVGWVQYSVKFMNLWEHLDDAVKTGRPQWCNQTENRSMWEAFFDDAQSRDTLVRSFEPFARDLGMVIAREVALPPRCVVVDVGGGSGRALVEILRKYSGITGIVFDLPFIVPFAEKAFKSNGLSSQQATVVPGNFFSDDLPLCDVIILGWILHDWSDDNAAVILEKCRCALPPNGLLLAGETILKPELPNPYDAISSIDMLLSTYGRERTLDDLRGLLTSCSFRLETIVETSHNRSVIVCRRSS